ncbi:MAG TPA: tetratricopeptide repeat protein, partial [Chloroflexi bacterium]|nr:tetratricopeptide repeat protein [Chloroflexota bacterium]
MRLTGERLELSRDRRRSNPWRVLALLTLIVGGVLLLRAEQQGEVQPLFLPTPTATRNALSHAEEAEAHFAAGNIEAAIQAYREAVSKAPNDAALWANLARLQTYSSALHTTLESRRERLAEARKSIDRAVELNPDSAFAHAIRTLVYDWSASAEVKDVITVGDRVRVVGVISEGGRITANVIELEGLGEAEARPETEVSGGAGLLFSG